MNFSTASTFPAGGLDEQVDVSRGHPLDYFRKVVRIGMIYALIELRKISDEFSTSGLLDVANQELAQQPILFLCPVFRRMHGGCVCARKLVGEFPVRRDGQFWLRWFWSRRWSSTANADPRFGVVTM